MGEPDVSARSEPRASARASVREGRGGVYLLTSTTYGTWLPGHERGFVSRVPDGSGEWMIHNEIETPFDTDRPGVRAKAAARMSGERVVLSRSHACAVKVVCDDVCRDHSLEVLAGAVMATHMHLVVRSSEIEDAKVLQLFKGTISRRLTQAFGPPLRAPRWWTHKGSHRLLTSIGSIRGAVVYVIDEQADPLETFGSCVQDVPEWWVKGYL